MRTYRYFQIPKTGYPGQAAAAGLHVLEKHDKLKITIEVGCCGENHCLITSQLGGEVLFTAEEQADCCSGDGDVVIRGSNGSNVLHLERSINVFDKDRLFVSVPGVGSIGTIQKNTTFLMSEYEVFKAQTKTFKISQNFSLGSYEYEILSDGGHKIGFIKRKMRLGTDIKYDLDLPLDADVVDKALLLAAMFLISYIERLQAASS